MSRPLPPIADHALDPVRDALRAAARADAAAVLRGAEDRRDAMLASARRTGDELVADARLEGEAEATAVLTARMANSRRDARRTVLAAQRELYVELRRRCRVAAVALVGSPDYERVRKSLVAHAEELLGPEATVTDSPDGGVLASAGSRRLDLSLPAMAERVVDRSGAEVAALWSR
ncbi:hypothetical protein AB0H36_05580 [Kribbella sp. NPDC050820]|uniref:hypothetical protein n=1 Tax=Kribbella sp. NPDC050820 TaxID=3155408 RepID=UPI0034000AA5